MEVPVGEDAVKAVGVAVARLVQELNSLDYSFGVSEPALKDIGDLCFRLCAVADDGSVVPHGGYLVDEVSVVHFCPERGVDHDVAGGSLADLGVAEHGDGFVEGLEERDVARFHRLVEMLRLLDGCHGSLGRHANYT